MDNWVRFAFFIISAGKRASLRDGNQDSPRGMECFLHASLFSLFCLIIFISGMGDTNDQNKPTYVDALRGVSVQQIACGSGHTVVLTTEGCVYTWGRGGELP